MTRLSLPQPIAFTSGSMWYCPEHAMEMLADGEYLDPVRDGNLFAEYRYHCDTCGRDILCFVDSLTQDAMWKIGSAHDADTRDEIFATYGRAVLIKSVQDGVVRFFPDAGRATEGHLTVPVFAELFEFCHLTGTVCQHCHSAPGRLKI